MERFKECERESKTKAYSKEGLARAESGGASVRVARSCCRSLGSAFFPPSRCEGYPRRPCSVALPLILARPTFSGVFFDTCKLMYAALAVMVCFLCAAKQTTKRKVQRWLEDFISRVSDLIDSVEAEIELVSAQPSSKKKSDKSASDELETHLANHRLHVHNMEIVRRTSSS
jgi:hypothetical protein